LGVNFLGFARQGSVVVSRALGATLAERPEEIAYAHGFLGHWSKAQVVPK
jgi:hypothetical protein